MELVWLVVGYLGALGSVPILFWGAGQVSRARARARARRAIAGSPRLLGESGEGTVVRLTGRVRALGPPLRAPLSGLPCVAYRSRVFSIRQALGTPFPVGQPIDYRTVELQPFALVRPDGRDVLVEASYAEFDLPEVPLQLTRMSEQAFFYQHRLIATGGAGRFDEVIVADGDTVTIAGLLNGDLDIEAEEERGFRDGPPRKLQLVGNGPHPLVIGRAKG